MDREALKQVIADQREYRLPKTLFERSQVKDIQRFKEDPSILILSGMRRSGKSTIQRIFQKELFPSDYYFNFDDERLLRFGTDDFQMLLEIFIELFGKQSIFYFDEIQNIQGWERFIRRLYEKGHKIFITGSNAKLLSKELGTHLTGRYIQFEIYPLSFREILQQKHPEILPKKVLSTEDIGTALHHFAEYFQYGGIPEYFQFRKPEYLKDLYEGILYRDIIARYNLAHEKPLQELVYYFASNIGKEFSYSKLAEMIGLGSSHTVSNYCSYLEQCYLCFSLNRYSPSLQKQIQYNKKCYMIDPALIRTVGFRTSADKGRLLENLAFLHLKMQGEDLYFHKGQKECDFLVKRSTQITHAIQVTTSLSDSGVKAREIAGLAEAMDAYGLERGLILTENETASLEIGKKKVAVLPLWKWLLSRLE